MEGVVPPQRAHRALQVPRGHWVSIIHRLQPNQTRLDLRLHSRIISILRIFELLFQVFDFFVILFSFHIEVLSHPFHLAFVGV
mmetsp:Transcript_38348/g.36713  ORF Transcript_38348/g.36713 Transcript_38348/m.36713 type:complete len:83 (+) Transcript_38348:298-546(+)